MSQVSGSVHPTSVSFDLTATSGQAITFNAPYDEVIITNGSTVAALTFNLPTAPAHGDEITISNFAAITAVTMVPTVSGMPSGLTAGQGARIKYSANMKSVPAGWYKYV